MSGLKASQAINHPAYAHVVRYFPPTETGTVQTKTDWGIKCDIKYEVHGKGPKKLIWVSGLGVIRWFWQRQVKEFGHDMGSEYSCLVFDHRGMGESGKPWIRYTMPMFARDIIAVADAVGWTGERQLHVIGASMGGMMLQELALMIPDRIASLILCSTGPRLINTAGFWGNLKNQIRVFIPQSLDHKLARMKATFISDEYANQPDSFEETGEGMPLFPLRGDRWVAEMAYMHRSPQYSHWGWFRQALAIPGWRMDGDDLARIGDLVGRDRILSMHGTTDKGMSIVHNEELVRGLGGSGEKGITLVLLDGCGHIPPIEKRAEFARLIADFVDKTQALREKS